MTVKRSGSEPEVRVAGEGDWERERPPVRWGCWRCKVDPKDVIENRVVVSPTGAAHFGEGGITKCGIDATGEFWWWPL